MDKPNRASTDVTKWLKKNYAEQHIIEAFYDKGYYQIGDVDKEAIDKIVGSGEENRGFRRRLIRSLEDATREGPPAMVPPTLPKGTVLDLSAPELTSSDGTTFTVTKSLTVERTSAAIRSPNNLTPEEWMVIARGANLLYGYNMESDEPEAARTPVLDWKVPDRNDFVRSEISHATVTSSLTYSYQTASYVKSGFDTETATAAYAFCAASFERSHKEKSAKRSEKKELIQVGTWKYPRALIYLEKCTQPSQRFVDSVDAALALSDREIYTALQDVFEEYGHVIPSSILLGGLLCYRLSKTIDATASESQTETTLKTAVEAKLGKASASAGFALGSAERKEDSSSNLQEFTSFTSHGGDSLLCTNPPEWAPSVKDPNNWAAIEMEDMRLTIDLLDCERKKKVLDVWERHQAFIGSLQELEWRDGYSKTIKPGGGFAAAMRQCNDGPRGSVHLVSSNPSEGNPGRAAGAAYAHKWKDGDTWIECNSVCLPVPQGGSLQGEFETSWGNPCGRYVFIHSDLIFGAWRPAFGTKSVIMHDFESLAKDDGFLFVSIQALKDGDVGGVKGLIDGEEVAGSYIHWYTVRDENIKQQSFCIPVPKGSRYEIALDHLGYNPQVRADWIPLTDQRRRMQKAVPVNYNNLKKVDTDGILHGWIHTSKGVEGERGTLKLYIGDEACRAFRDKPENLPCAAASMHYYLAADRRVKYSSVMLPVAKGDSYIAKYDPSSLNPPAEIFWTAIVPPRV